MLTEEGHRTHLEFRSLVQTVLQKKTSSVEEEWEEVQRMFDKPAFKLLLRNINGFVLIFNYKTCFYEYCSEGVTTHLGYNAEEFIGSEGVSKVYSAFHPEQADFFVQPILQDVFTYLSQNATPQTGTDFRFTCCMKIRNSAGGYLWHIIDTIILQTDDRGLPYRTMVTCTNIHHHKKNELIYYHVSRKNGQGMYQIVFQKQVQVGREQLTLSKREIEVLAYIGQGLTNRKIADRLFLSQKTVQTHRRNILRKTACKGTAELTRFAFSRGLI